MKTVLLNLPYQKRVMRRWVASYYAPNFLIPPLELMSLGAIIKEWKKYQVWLIDAIAEKWNQNRVLKEIQKINPDILVTMTGFNIFPKDINSLEWIARQLPQIKVICFGYLPTQFHQETLSRTEHIDIIIKNEPELTFSEVYDCLKGDGDLSRVKGIAYKTNGDIVNNDERERITDLDALPFPDHSLINLKLYSESFLDRPIGVIMTERGCPYDCIYCVKTYGNKLVSRSTESILAEINHLVKENKVRNIRFLDDTFTLNRNRLINICRELIKRNLRINWTCLTRLDVLDGEILNLMKKSGCKRMYIGIESGSQRIMDYYRKGYTVEIVKDKMKEIKNSGLEVSAFFLVGAPIETDEEVKESIRLAKELDLDYIIVTKLQFWPGTELFEKEQEKLKFDLFGGGEIRYSFPGYENSRKWQRRFYRDFYLRRGYVSKRVKTLIRSPRDILTGFYKLGIFLLKRNSWEDFI